MKGIFFISLFTAIIFTQCYQKSHISNDVEDVLFEVVERFEQLPRGTGRLTDFYKLQKTVIIGEENIHLQLRSTPDSIDDRQQIIVIVNPDGKCAAIPFFSNTYRDYWNFEFDTIIPSIKRTNTTFSKEFDASIAHLNLNDTLDTSRTILSEIFFSLLNCELVTELDSLKFDEINMIDNKLLLKEDSDECHARTKRNFKTIKEDIFSKSIYARYYSACWDKKNNRIYQVANIHTGRFELFYPQIKTYRQDCVYHLLTL